MRFASRVKNDNVLFAKIVTLKIATGAEHSVSLWHSAVASFSSAKGIREFRVEKFISALCAAERIEFLAYPGDHGWFVPTKYFSTLFTRTSHFLLKSLNFMLEEKPKKDSRCLMYSKALSIQSQP